ncbi:DNA primase [Methylococcus capsulatus]|uniref:DNA primase n=1 Tax=Methylococcus capsulatus TaxID=414 RepID=UPI001C529AC7|nr:DNA primase [Methylococcus capsulatus]QXP90021.1 DNA primase [Methylococcus capsulatus]
MSRYAKAAPGWPREAAHRKATDAHNFPQNHRSSQPVGELLARLDAVRRTGDGRWLARCPAHADRSPSLSIKLADDGRILVHDFAGCPVEDVLAAVGLEVKDLFPPRDPPPEGFRPRHGIPEHRARDLIRLAAREAGIASIVIQDILSGNGTSVDDCQRALRAAETLAEIAREVSSHA